MTVVQGNFDGQSGRLSADQAMANAIARTGNQVKAQHFFFANGQQVGSFGQLQDAGSDFKANFDVNFTPISDSYPASTPAQVIVQAGDTLRVIAARVFGDANLWYLIAEENGLTDPDAELEEGTILRVPNDVVSLSNSAQSFKPFDVSDAIGDTTPTQPMPPPRKKKGCGVVGQILMVVVAIVVSVYLGPAAGNAIASITGATSTTAVAAASAAGYAVGAAAGSIASQGVGIAIGQQDSFSWKSVASAAITAGLAPGVGGLTAGLSGATQQIAVAALNNAVGQGVNIALGLQDSFSWQAVAASAVAAPIAVKIGQKAGETVGRALDSNTAGRIAGQAAYGLTMQATRSAFVGGKIDYAQIAADSFGMELGNSIAKGLTKPGTQIKVAAPGSQAPATANPGMNNNPLPFDEQEMLRKFDAENRANLEATIAGMEVPNIGPFEYVVQSGDTLSQIGVAMGMGPEGAVAIAKANGIADLNQVRAGQTIVIPDSAGYDRSSARTEYVQFLEDTNVRNVEYAAREQMEAQARGLVAFDEQLTSSMYAPSPTTSVTPSMVEAGVASTVAKYAVGGAETVLGSIYNYGARIASGVVSLPFLLDSVEAAASVQEGFMERAGYNVRSQGAQDIAAAIQPVAQFVQNDVLTSARDFATAHIGDATTSILFGGAQAALEIGGLVGGVGAARSFGTAAVRAEAAENIVLARNILRETRPELSIVERNQIIRNFELESFRVKVLDTPATEFRYFDGVTAQLGGRWSTSEWFGTPAERISNLALPGNQATRAATVTMQPGATVFQGTTAPQLRFGLDRIGGAPQTYYAQGPRLTFRELP